MKKKYAIIALIVTPLALMAVRELFMQSIPLIPRTILFGNPEKAYPSISPNGKYLAYVAPLDAADESSKLNIWIKTIDKNDDHPLTSATDRSIQSYFWAYDSSEILYIRDTKGDENWQLFGIKIDTKETTCYTPFEKVQARVMQQSKKEPKILLGLNKDNPALHDVYSLDLKTNTLTLVCKNPGMIVQWVADQSLTLRAALREEDDGGRTLLTTSDNGVTWHNARSYDSEDNQNNCYIAGVSGIHNLIYILESKEYNTARLVSYNMNIKEVAVIAQDPQYDITGLLMHPDTEEVEVAFCNKDKHEWIILKEGVYARIHKAFSERYPGNINILSCDYNNDLQYWVIAIGRDTCPAIYYLYNDKTGAIRELFKARPTLNEKYLAPMEPVIIKSRDGLTLHSYLTCPKNSVRKQLPLVLFVHGGPNVRDEWAYNGQVQWLANRGYAVLQVNYRGSTGYGKDFINAADKEWGGKMHDDLIDAVQWAIDTGIANPKKIAIFGGSYGGYAALCGAAFTPKTFCCAVDVVGVSNLLTFLRSIPPYWKLYLTKLYKTIGNPDTEEAFLKSRSPLYAADAIKIPLLIAQGAHDPRVKQEESEQIVATLKKHGIEHEYLLFPDEGHGFVNAHNRLAFFTATEAFLARHLGGRSEA